MAMDYRTYGGSFQHGIGKGFRFSFRHGSSLTRLIYINCAIFLSLKILYVLFLLVGKGKNFYDNLLEWVGVPAYPENLLYTPWTPLTYMFTQFGFTHLLFNMLWLYWFGGLFLDYFTERQLTGVYLLGGIAGAALYIAAYAVFPYFDTYTRMSSWAIGSSASVMAIVFAICTYLPHHKVYIFLIGPVKLLYLAIFTAIIDFLSIPYGNSGGHIAHLGGAFLGWLFILGVRHNNDFVNAFTGFLERVPRLFSLKRKIRVKYKKPVSQMNDREYNDYKKRQEDRINEILDKISKSGYESLSREEKEILFRGRN